MAKSLETSPQFHVAFNALGAASPRPDHVLFASRGTLELGRRAVALERKLAETFDTATVSVIPGRNLDLAVLAKHFFDNNVSVSSVDVPDVQSIPQGLLAGVGNFFRGDIARAKSHVGWTLSNVGTERQQQQRTKEALTQFSDDEHSVQLVKANTAFWL